MEREKIATIVERRSSQLAWGVLVLGWSLTRALGIRYFFKQYGINFWYYLTVDLLTSIPYAKFSAELAIALLKKNDALVRRAIIGTAIFFYLPDLYVIAFAISVPRSLWMGFGISMLIFSAIAIWQILQSVRKKDATKE